MSRIILIVLMTLLSKELIAQNHSYTFQGHLDAEKQNIIQNELLKLNIEKITFHYKAEISAGQLIFSVGNPNTSGENTPNWSPVDVKNILITHGLEPGEFNALKE